MQHVTLKDDVFPATQSGRRQSRPERYFSLGNVPFFIAFFMGSEDISE